mmetsp:Transcript_19776/g.18823  ORF Transcript_19776/g.18823 Transcript_19776/m.18823 type:complete len:140 (-) Transcript_19776:2278-2697(-)
MILLNLLLDFIECLLHMLIVWFKVSLFVMLSGLMLFLFNHLLFFFLWLRILLRRLFLKRLRWHLLLNGRILDGQILFFVFFRVFDFNVEVRVRHLFPFTHLVYDVYDHRVFSFCRQVNHTEASFFFGIVSRYLVFLPNS